MREKVPVTPKKIEFHELPNTVGNEIVKSGTITVDSPLISPIASCSEREISSWLSEAADPTHVEIIMDR